MIDFINGNKFADMADFCIDGDNRNIDLSILSRNAIIYCKTDFLTQLFTLLRFSRRKYILISHMSDYPIDERLFNLAPPCIIKWFAQNAVYNNNRLIPIPIGIENHKGISKGGATDHEWLHKNLEVLRSNVKDEKVVYCNWTITNNPQERTGVLNELNVQYLWDREFGGISYYEYCDHVSRHKFMICPPGHGVSVHQAFEAMYFGCIPIVKRHNIYKNCEDMPMIQVNNWSEVNYELLEAYNNRTFNMDKIYMAYWEKLIRDEFNNI